MSLKMKTAEQNNCTIIDHASFRFVSVLVAAGQGSRAGLRYPKQYRPFLGEPVLIASLRVLMSHEQHLATIIVHPSGDGDIVRRFVREAGLLDEERVILVEGGQERTQSVKNGIAAAKRFSSTAILVHDAARPGVISEDISRLLIALGEHEGAAPALPIVDSLKHSNDSGIRSVSRENLFRIQTPQAFRTEVIIRLFDDPPENTTDEFTLAENANRLLVLTKGSERLSKLTFPEDFRNLEAILSKHQNRIGVGYDVHAFEDGEHVTLCGIQIPHSARLKGHSDADVAWHALTDAILGAIGAGDIGDHFPPSDPQWKGVPSSVFLKEADRLVREKNGEIVNLDITLICEAPKVKPFRAEMIRSTAELLGMESSCVSIKATTTEGLGFEGRREGIAAQAIANVRLFTRQSYETA
jgi:2-C-methyl-D-erythritol 4-phosphate cytidylyltransferase/2-C-methyl-D-erythritol 2,4-cyclodiphosphate synthase